ncbi:unnamed protein product [Coregonus sp. 'balchen']|nr:unnamed protein product [Coregonus sp. 'balchen']
MAQGRITEVEHTFVQVEDSMDSVRLLFEECIDVGRLESRRGELVWELLHLEQLILQAKEALKGQFIQLEYINLQIEVGQVKSKRFVIARDCIQSQLALAARQYEMAQSTVTQETVDSVDETMRKLKLHVQKKANRQLEKF